MKLKFQVIMIIFFIFSSYITVASYNEQEKIQILNEKIFLSKPSINHYEDFLILKFEESESYLLKPGKPMLPVIKKEYTFPKGTKIVDVSIDLDINEMPLYGKIEPAQQNSILNQNKNTNDILIDEKIYSSTDLYPENPFIISKGMGIDKDSKVLLLTINIIPQYSPANNILYITNEINIEIKYELPTSYNLENNEYDMVIIAPEEFLSQINPLLEHKNNYGINTFIETTEEIYNEYPGRDKPEKIKYFIKDAMDEYDISYVLLIGSVNKIPMRVINWDLGDDILDMLTDLYYADLLDSQEIFCTWDGNENDVFGEENDNLDFYPDVHIGRLACDNIKEVEIVVDKIINYETGTYGESWFNKMIIMGGDTFPEELFPGAIGSEGEKHNEKIMSIMKDFEHFTIWTSKGNFNRETIAEEINKGAGFLFFSGHGIEYGVTPDYGSNIHYYKRYINDLTNGYKLPIMYFTACSTAKPDFNMGDLISYYLPHSICNLLSLVPLIDMDKLISNFSWSFVKHEGGGSIATIGSTQLIISSGYDEGGCVNPPIYFFDAYNTSETLGQMMTKAVNENINDIPTDYWAEYTIEEHILYGDPSLRLGGYP